MTVPRRLFAELMAGIDAMCEVREDQAGPRAHELEVEQPLAVAPNAIRMIRERLNLSLALFARRLRASPRTLERWEQGRTRLKARAAGLILMVRESPDTLDQLGMLDRRPH